MKSDKDPEDLVAQRTVDLMGLADVHRWTVIRTLRTQSVAEHSFNVAVIVMELTDRLQHLGVTISPEQYIGALEWALIHDAPETLTGDIDGKFKREYPAVRAEVVAAEHDAFLWYRKSAAMVSPRVNAIVKIADKLEAIQFIRQWGIGGRASAVESELGSILNEYITANAAVIGATVLELWAIVRAIAQHPLTEEDNIQERLARRARQKRASAADTVAPGMDGGSVPAALSALTGPDGGTSIGQ